VNGLAAAHRIRIREQLCAKLLDLTGGAGAQ